MDHVFWMAHASYVALAVVLFFLINWIGTHAIDFGYVSTSLFEEANESVALNFFIRTLSPSVFKILISSAAVAADRSNFRIGIVNVVPYYYGLRALVIIMLNRQGLISWPRYFTHAAVGISFAILVYQYLILPNRSLIPDLETAGNELWLALLAFMYAVANKINLSSGPGARRRNAFVRRHYIAARARFGQQIDEKVADELLKLIAYSILVYEDYCRPPSVRAVERLAIWKKKRTTGIMQVAADVALTDSESVNRGLDILLTSWENHSSEEHLSWRIRRSISDYNMDDDYIQRVQEVMEILAKRADPSFRPVYESIWDCS